MKHNAKLTEPKQTKFKIMRLIVKSIFCIIFLYCITALFYNLYLHHLLSKQILPFNQGWYHYKTASLSTDTNIYPDLVASLKSKDTVFISMFLWPYAVTEKTKNLPPLEMLFANVLKNKQIHGKVFLDGINFNYKSFQLQMKNNPVIQSTPNLQWITLSQPYSLPNNIIMWIIHTPWLQMLIDQHGTSTLQEIYAVLKIASNHQKIVVINNGESAWIGSRNFNRINWNNNDQFVNFTGDIAKAIYLYAIQTIAYLNPDFENLYKDIKSQANVEPVTISTDTTSGLAKLLHTAEIKPTILYLIRHSSQIDGEISLFDDGDIIDALNQLIKQKGKINLILDPNQYIFQFKMPYMPNIVAIHDLAPQANIRIQNTHFQLHSKVALFTLTDGSMCYLNSTANWTRGALVYFAYNDAGIVVCNDQKIINQFKKNFAVNWQNSTSREKIDISQSTGRYWLSRFMSLIGFNPW